MTGAEVVHARGTGITSGTDEELASAVALARDADVAIVVLGERSGLTDNSTTGEFRDRRQLGFLGRQQELLEAVVATGTPVVLVVVSGRPLALPWAAEHCAAILLAWVPGDAGPDAIAAVLTGRRQSGRQAAGLDAARRRPAPADVPPPPHRRSLAPQGRLRRRARLAAVAVRVRPLVHDVRRRRAAPRSAELATAGDAVTIRRRCHEHRRRVAGDEVVQLYVRDEEASVARPVRELRGFRRVRLDTRGVPDRRLPALDRAVRLLGADLRRVVEPGRVSVQVGTSSVDLPLAAELRLRGPRRRAHRCGPTSSRPTTIE